MSVPWHPDSLLASDLLKVPTPFFFLTTICFLSLSWIKSCTFIYLFLLLSSTVFSIFTPPRPPAPPISASHLRTYPFGFVHLSFTHVLDGPSPIFPHYPSPTSLLVTVSLFLISMSLFIFACLFVLIRFHLKVRSYGICLSLSGLFH